MDFHCKWSPPSRAAWIEIAGYRRTCRHGASPPSRAAWIEIPVPLRPSISPTSPPSRAAWIEIPLSAIISAMYRHCIRRWYVCSALPV